MKIFFLLFTASVSFSFLNGCAALKDSAGANAESASSGVQQNGNSDKAMDYFIRGAISEMKDNYAEAILDYQEALKYEKASGIFYAISRNYFKLNKLSQSLVWIKSAIEIDSLNADYFNLLAAIYSSAFIPDSAALAYEKIIGLDSANYSAYFNLAKLYESSKPNRALSLYKDLLNLTGPEWQVLVRIAELNERMGNMEQTAETIEKLVQLDPSNLQLQKLLAETYLKLQQYPKSLKILNDALTVFPGDITLLELKAQNYLLQGDWQSASRSYSELIRSNEVPFESRLRISAGFFNQAVKDTTVLDEARKLFEYLNKDTLDWQVKLYLGEIYLKQKKDSAAIVCFREGVKLASWNVNAWVRLGGLLFDSGKYDETLDFMNEAQKLFPEDFVVNLLIGFTHSQLKDNEKALLYLEKAVALNPADLNAVTAYAFTFHQLKKTDQALIYLKKALEIDSANVQVYSMMGTIYDDKEMWDESDRCFTKALSLDSADALTLNNYAYALSERGIRLQEALSMVSSALKKDPDNSAYLDTKGWIYFKMEDFNKALEYVTMAVEKDKKSSTLRDHLGDIYFRLGNMVKAIELWKEALELDSANETIRMKIERGIL